MTERPHRSRTGLPGLLLRQSRASLAQLLTLFGAVLAISALASTAPLALQSLTTAEIGHDIGTLPAVQRDIIGTAPGGPVIGPNPASDPYGTMDGVLAQQAADTPQPLRGALGSAQWVSASNPFEAYRLGVDFNDPIAKVYLTVAPGVLDQVRITEGRAPAAIPANRAPDIPVQIMLSTTAAERMQWRIDETRTVPVGLAQLPVTLSGTFEAVDPRSDFWTTLTTALTPALSHTSFAQDYTPIYTGNAFIDPDSWPALDQTTLIKLTTVIRYPFHAEGMSASTATALLPQLRQFLVNDHVLGSGGEGNTVDAVGLRSPVVDHLSTALARGAAATVVVVMAAAGPAGVAVAVLLLLSRLLVLRRREALSLIRARGAAGWQLRLWLASESLLFSAPAAAIGAAIAFLLYPREASIPTLAYPAIVALTPAVIAGLAAAPPTLRTARADLAPRSRRRIRWILETIVLALTVLATGLLLQRGVITTSAGRAVDPLLAATPLLLALSTALVVLRLYPVPLLALGRWLRRRRGIVAQLGTLRAIRDSATGLAPVLALVVGVSVTVFSGMLLSTVSAGVSDSARSTVGADLRVTAVTIPADQLDALAALAGVEAVAPISTGSSLVTVRSYDDQYPATLLLTDTESLARVQADVPGHAVVPPGMAQRTDDGIPVVMSDRAARDHQDRLPVSLSNVPVHAVGDPGTSDSLANTADWVLVDRGFGDAFTTLNVMDPSLVLIRLAPGADAATVAADVQRSVPGSTVQTPARYAAQLGQSPIASGLQAILLAMVLAVGLLCATAIILALMIGAPARERLLSLLRIMGSDSRQSRGIVGWEIGPSAIVAVVVGAALGIGLTFVVLAGLDLRIFTSGVTQPAASIDPLLLLAITGGFVLIVFVAAAAAMAALRRINLARTLRTSEEG